MNLIETKISGLYLINNFNSKDDRGSLTKIFNNDEFSEMGINITLDEVYYSISKKDVIRGMHFQTPPYDHEKLVHVINGEIIDVVLDLRKNSSTYGEYMIFNLNERDKVSLCIPKGCAHGFLSTVDDTIMLYQVTKGYNSKNDEGIRYDSFGYDWGISQPIISERDRNFLTFNEYVTPF